jgi:hypothetical protein
MNRFTHIAAASSARADEAALLDILSAVPPVTQPPQAKPTMMVATAQAAQLQNSVAFEAR